MLYLIFIAIPVVFGLMLILTILSAIQSLFERD
jgi:hypothetical protein